MSRTGSILAGTWLIVFATGGCATEDSSSSGGTAGLGAGGGVGGNGGTGASAGAAGGSGGTAGSAGSGGGVPQVCASFWEAPADAPIVSEDCTYALGADPPTRDCTAHDESRKIFEYANERCGFPCITGRVPATVNGGLHFDAAGLPLVEQASFPPGSVMQSSSIRYTLDSFGNETQARTFDSNGSQTGASTTTYTGSDPAMPESFETRLDDSTLISSGTLTWQPSTGRLLTFEITLNVGFIPPSRFEYSYNADGTLDEVVWYDIEQTSQSLLGSFLFDYPLPQATVTFLLPDSTVRSVITYDFACP